MRICEANLINKCNQWFLASLFSCKDHKNVAKERQGFCLLFLLFFFKLFSYTKINIRENILSVKAGSLLWPNPTTWRSQRVCGLDSIPTTAAGKGHSPQDKGLWIKWKHRADYLACMRWTKHSIAFFFFTPWAHPLSTVAHTRKTAQDNMKTTVQFVEMT